MFANTSTAARPRRSLPEQRVAPPRDGLQGSSAPRRRPTPQRAATAGPRSPGGHVSTSGSFSGTMGQVRTGARRCPSSHPTPVLAHVAQVRPNAARSPSCAVALGETSLLLDSWSGSRALTTPVPGTQVRRPPRPPENHRLPRGPGRPRAGGVSRTQAGTASQGRAWPPAAGTETRLRVQPRRLAHAEGEADALTVTTARDAHVTRGPPSPQRASGPRADRRLGEARASPRSTCAPPD